MPSPRPHLVRLKIALFIAQSPMDAQLVVRATDTSCAGRARMAGEQRSDERVALPQMLTIRYRLSITIGSRSSPRPGILNVLKLVLAKTFVGSLLPYSDTQGSNGLLFKARLSLSRTRDTICV
jgi:hypothetical protein